MNKHFIQIIRGISMSINNLNNVPIFIDLDEVELTEVNKTCTPRNYPKNSMIILEEEFGDIVFIIITGTVKITRVNDEGKEVILSLLGPGEIFGEMAILDGEARSANALAQENCELIAIQRSEFLSMLRRNFKISFALMGELARIAKTNNQLFGPNPISLDEQQQNVHYIHNK